MSLLVLVVLGGLGYGAFWLMSNYAPAGTEQTGLPSGTSDPVNTNPQQQISKTEYLCSQQPTITAKFRVKDLEQSADTYLANGTGYWVPQGLVQGSRLVTQTAGIDTAGAYSTSGATLLCGETYDLWVADTANSQGYAVTRNVVIGTAPVDITAESRKTSALQARIKDNTADAYIYNDAGANTFSNLADSWINDSTNAATIDAGTGGAHDFTISVKTQTQDTVFGMSSDEVAVLVDASSTKWNEPSTSLGSNIKDAQHFDSYDLTAISDYEYAYQFSQVVDTQKSFDFYITAVSGVDPGATDDVKIRFIAKGVVLDSKDNQNVRKGYFGNGATFTEIQGSTEEITIDEAA